MKAFSVVHVIHAPLNDVWAVASDPVRFPEWMHGLSEASLPEEGAMAVGAKIPVAVLSRGEMHHAQVELIEWDPPCGFSIRAGSERAGTLYRYRFESMHGGEATRASLVAEIHFAGKMRFFAWLLRRGMKKADGHQLKTLANMVPKPDTE